MKEQILAVTIGISLTGAVLAPAIYNQAFAQVTAESRVLQAILGLTDQIKQQTTEIKGKYDDTIFDLNVKKKFYEISDSLDGDLFAAELFIEFCNDVPDGACAFNVESIQIQCGNDPILVETIRVDGTPTDISDKGIFTPTNLLVDAGIGKIGASDSVRVEVESCGAPNLVTFVGEKPQGVDLDILLFEE